MSNNNYGNTMISSIPEDSIPMSKIKQLLLIGISAIQAVMFLYFFSDIPEELMSFGYGIGAAIYIASHITAVLLLWIRR